MPHEPSLPPTPPVTATLDVRELAPRLGLVKIRQALEALAPGQALVLLSDHDPRSSCERLQAEQPGRLEWRYLDTGPAAWRVELRKDPADAPGGPPVTSPARPAALSEISENRQVHLDVRPDIARGEEPFARIMAAVRALGETDILVLRAPFEPIPLYGVLGRRGLAHWIERREPADWLICFYPDRSARSTTEEGGAAGTPAPGRLDVRGLEPPLPMVRVLEAVDRLAPGQALEVLHDRRPMFLYPQLEERGFLHQTDEPEPGLVRILIRRSAR